jgi:integrase
MKNKAGSGAVTKYTTKSGDRLWRYRFDGDPVDGKRRMISAQGFATRSEAKEKLRLAVAAYKERKELPAAAAPPPSPSPSPPPKQTLAEWVRVWLRDYAPNKRSPLTLQRYHGLAGYILDATIGEPAQLAATPLDEVDHCLVEAALYYLLRAPAKRRKHLSSKTVREVASVLSVALNKAFKLGRINVNPLLRVELPKVQRVAEARSLVPEEVQRLREICRGDWTFGLVELGLATGCRRGELLALTWSDVDYISSKLKISKSLEQTKKGGLRVKLPKSEKTRRFRIGLTAIATLRFLQEQQKEFRRLCGADYKDLGLVFCQPDGSYLLPDLVSQVIVRRLKKAGIENASLHTLRHTHASILLSKGVPLTAVSERLGHADVNITARIYGHALPDDDDRAAAAWEVWSAPGSPRETVPEISVTSCDVRTPKRDLV